MIIMLIARALNRRKYQFVKKTRERRKLSEPKYIEFRWSGYSKSGTTETWKIVPKDLPKDSEVVIGIIKWDGPWRCYSCFIYPWMFANKDDYFKYEKVCMRDIANFCEKATKLQREKKLGATATSQTHTTISVCKEEKTEVKK
jgi:hypothetical protein